MSATLYLDQPIVQTAFRNWCSASDDIQAVRQVDISVEYNKPLYTTFTIYEIACDSVESSEIIQEIKKQGVNELYMLWLKEYTEAVQKPLSKQFLSKTGVTQGDAVSTKLCMVFTEVHKKWNYWYK